MRIGVVEGYQPEQPIAFSHKIHAGDNKIDCNYCHSSARSSKIAGVPSVNVCMNCHASIKGSTDEDISEIQKIYDAVGFNPETGKYIEDYEQKPIEWVRVRSLPDSTYFNHFQNVTVEENYIQLIDNDIAEKLKDSIPLRYHYWITALNGGTDVMAAHNKILIDLKEDSRYNSENKFTFLQEYRCTKCHIANE